VEKAGHPSAIREERKVVTAIFADLVGSTALGESLDPEDVKLIVGDAVARVVRAVEEFGGTVKDLAGDGVLALFGAPVAHEDDPERAIRAALRIVDDIKSYGQDVARAWGTAELEVRVGINTGPMVLGAIGGGGRIEYGAFGDSVNTAARLQAAAAPGSVLVGHATHLLVRPLFEWSPPVELQLKGKAEPVTAYQALGATTVSGRLRADSPFQAELVGRQSELALGQQALDEVLAGSGGVLFISGEAGIGKSRLLLELRTRFDAVAANGARPLWLEGRCVSYGESLPYWPFRDLLREWLGAGAQEAELRVRVALRRRIDRLFGERSVEIYPYLASVLGLALEPDAAARLGELSPEALQYRTFEVIRALFERLAEDGPVVVALEDLHWADATSLQLVDGLLAMTEDVAVLLVVTDRPERDHPTWRAKERAAREFPHRTRQITLEALTGEANRQLLHSLVGPATLPEPLQAQILERAEGNPFYLEELVRTLTDAGAVARTDGGWRFDHEVPFEIPPTVEKVILARIDRLSAGCHDVLTTASVLGRRFGWPLLEGVSRDDGQLRGWLNELQRLDLIREERRWPQPEYRFKHALIQEAAYRTLLSDQRTGLHRKAAEWLERHYAGNEGEVFGLLAHHWLAAADEDKAVAYLSRAADKAREEWSLDEAIGHYRSLLPLMERRGEKREMAIVLFKLALALHTSLRFAEANAAYQQAFEHWNPVDAAVEEPAGTVQMATSYLPRVPDPAPAGWWFDIQLCMQLFERLVEAWPGRTIVPSLADRWEISHDGLRYVFHLREGTHWSDGEPLSAHDVEFGIKRVLNPTSPGASVSVYFVLENAQDFYLRRHTDPDRIGVRALDDRTVEFRLNAPAPYFMNVINRPDGGPQPRHAIEVHGDEWTDPQKQVVSGPFQQAERTDDCLVLVRNAAYSGARSGNVARVEYKWSTVEQAIQRYDRNELDIIRVVYSPRVADHLPADRTDIDLGPAAWTGYVAFDHNHPVTSNVLFRRALAHAIDRKTLADVTAPNFLMATGGIVPPALHGHTPDIAPRFDPDLARDYLSRSGVTEDLGHVELAAQDSWFPMLELVTTTWKDVLGISVHIKTWNAHDVPTLPKPSDLAPIYIAGWLPGYPDPEYMLRLLLHTDAKTNEGGFSNPVFDELIDRARQEPRASERLELFHEADRMAVGDVVALIPLVYGRSTAFVKPWVKGWWEFGKTSSAFADLYVEPKEGRGRSSEPGGSDRTK
jgi:ABC-type transport system substrate-binding protein/class 3 adenylate cyclase